MGSIRVYRLLVGPYLGPVGSVPACSLPGRMFANCWSGLGCLCMSVESWRLGKGRQGFAMRPIRDY